MDDNATEVHYDNMAARLCTIRFFNIFNFVSLQTKPFFFQVLLHGV